MRTRGSRFLNENKLDSRKRFLIEVVMAVLRYIPAPPRPPLARDADADALKAAKAAADLQFVEEKKLQVIARRRETEIRNRSQARADPARVVSSKLRFSSSRCVALARAVAAARAGAAGSQRRARDGASSRAMNSFVRKFPQFALMGGQGRKRLYLYDTTNPESIAWAKASVKSRKFVARCEVKKMMAKLELDDVEQPAKRPRRAAK